MGMSTEPATSHWPTVADIQQELDRYSFSGLFASMQPRLELRCPGRPEWDPREVHWSSEPVDLLIYTTMPDRDTGDPVHVTFRRSVPLVGFRDEEMFHHWLMAYLRNVWQHEFQEGVRLDGELLNDPHVPGSIGSL